MIKLKYKLSGLKPGASSGVITPALPRAAFSFSGGARLGLMKTISQRALALTCLFLSLLFFTHITYGQQQRPAFWTDIQAFKKQDSAHFPGTNKILFIGSSSFTNWKDVQDYFPASPIINRGFGASTLVDQVRYVKDIVYPYRPKQIVIYCGENDLATSDTVSARTVYNRFRQLFNLIRGKFPNTPIIYISMKPSPSRQLLMPKMREGNALIQRFLKTKKQTGFIDVYKEMIDDEGKPRSELFLDDNLHMNKSGYAIWKKAIEPYLKK